MTSAFLVVPAPAAPLAGGAESAASAAPTESTESTVAESPPAAGYELAVEAGRSDAVPAAHLPFRGGTVLGHLCHQLSSIGLPAQRILASRSDLSRVRRPDASLAHGAEPVECADSVAAFRHIARVARAAATAGTADTAGSAARQQARREALAVLPGDLVAHQEALASLLDDSRISTGVLTCSDVAAGVAPVRVEYQRVVSAGSSYHAVTSPNAGFTGVIRVGPRDLEALARVADELAALARQAASARLDDVCALLLVGLVRAGVHVTASNVRALQCSRVSDATAVRRADEALRAVDGDRVRLDSAVKADDGFFTTYCVSPYSKHAVRWIAGRGVTPNAVTVLSLGIGVAAAGCFATGNRFGLVAGAVLLLLAFGADCVDGQLARYTRQFSAMGGWLDAMFDRAKEYAAYAGLAVGAATLTPTSVAFVWQLAIAALILQTGRHMVDFGYAAAHPGLAASPQRPLDEPGDGMAGRAPPGIGGARKGGGTRWLGLAARAVSGRLDRSEATRWMKKVVVLPIGERFALIAVTAAAGGPRVTFIALLAWGGLAAVYTLGGRVLRSLARTPAAAAGVGGTGSAAVGAYRDDGPVAWLVGASGVIGLVDQSWRGRSLALAGATLAAAGIIPALAAPAGWVPLVGAAWCVLAAGAVTGHHQPGRLDWLASPVLRGVEYTFIGVVGIQGGVPAALVFALLAALAYHHYDTVYQVRQRGRLPERLRWVSSVGLGWDGRMLVVSCAAAAGAATAGYALLVAGLWTLFIGASTASWMRAAAREPSSRARTVELEGE